MYCIMFIKDEKRVTHKYPLCSLFRVVEDYSASKRNIGFEEKFLKK